MRRHLDPDEWADIRGTIFVLFNQLGLADDERHRLQHAITGCSSLRYMTSDEHRKLVDTLEQLAEKPVLERNRTLQGLFALSSFDYRDID